MRLKDKEDVYFRYRVFIDRNGLSFTEQYRLNQDKAITLMKWCNDHDIPYKYRSEARGTYLQYDYDDLEGEIWQIPDMQNREPSLVLLAQLSPVLYRICLISFQDLSY